MATTGAKAPTAATTASYSSWAQNDWTNPQNIYGAGTASVTASTYDAGDRTYALKASGFDFSSIPDGATINGVTCVVNAYYATVIVSIDLAMLLDTSGNPTGTNQVPSPDSDVDLTTSPADYTIGSSSNAWGCSLTASWVKNSNFGVAIGCLAGGTGNTNNDVYIDSVTLNIDYTVNPLSVSKSDDISASESKAINISPLFISRSDDVSASDSVSSRRDLSLSSSDTASITESISKSHINYLSVSDSVVVSDSTSELRDLSLSASESVTIAESTAQNRDYSLDVSDSSSITESCPSPSVQEEGETPSSVFVSDQASLEESVVNAIGSRWTDWSDTWQFVTIKDRSISVSDSVRITDSTTENISPLLLSSQDSITIIETVQSRLDLLLVSLQDILSSLESVPAVELEDQAPKIVSTSDSVSISESRVEALDKLVLSVSDSSNASESISTFLPTIVASVQDSINTLETASSYLEDQAPKIVSVQDTASVSEEALSGLDVLLVSVQDLADSSESLQVVFAEYTQQCSTSDSVAIQESVSALLDVLYDVRTDVSQISDAAYAFLDVLVVSVSDISYAMEATYELSGKYPTIPPDTAYSSIGGGAMEMIGG